LGIVVALGLSAFFGVWANRMSSFNQQVESDLIGMRINAEKLVTETRAALAGDFDAVSRGRNSIDTLLDVQDRFASMHRLAGANVKANPYRVALPSALAQWSPLFDELVARGSIKTPQPVATGIIEFIHDADEILNSEVSLIDLNATSQRLARSTESLRVALEKIPTSPEAEEARAVLSKLLALASRLGTEKSYTDEDLRVLPDLANAMVASATKLRDVLAKATPESLSASELALFHATAIKSSTFARVDASGARNAEIKSATSFMDRYAVLQSVLATQEIDRFYERNLWIAAAGSFAMSLLIILGLMLRARHEAVSADRARNEIESTDNAIIQLIEEMAPIASGNLTSRLTVTEHVTGSLADSFNAATQDIQSAMKVVKSTAQGVSSSMSDIFALIAESDRSSANTAQLAHSAHQLSLEGMSVVHLATEKMTLARDRMKDVSDRVERLGQASQTIGKVVQIIEEVNEKTAILALNTALRAADAGEQGYAFRVLADEIKKLSGSINDSLSHISASVVAIQAETGTVVGAVERSGADIEQAAIHWGAARDSLEKITESSKDIEVAVSVIVDLSRKTNNSASKATDAIDALNDSSSNFITE
jgi:methyl-accepting chemotaxis protein